MEPKSLRSAAATPVAAMRAVAEDANAEQAAKLTKPVADARAFKTASWTSIPSPARTTPVESSTLVVQAAETKPNPNLAIAARVSTPQADVSLLRIQQDLAEIRSMLASLTEAVRGLQTSAARS